MKLRSPIQYFGGKGNMTAKIVPVLNNIPHTRYVEVFGGGASILLAKPPVSIEVYNDIDHHLYDFFTVLSNPRLFAKFYRRVAVMPYSRQLYYHCYDTWESETDLMERVVKWYITARQGFGGQLNNRSWSFCVTASGRGMARNNSSWLSIIKMLPEIHTRLQRVQIECRDFRFILDTYDTPETLFYIDPPYVHSTRDKAARYDNEMTDQDHQDLVAILLQLKGKAVLSGYNQEIYKPLEEAGWERKDWQTACHAAGKTRTSKLQGNGSALKNAPRIESVWIKTQLGTA